MADRIVIDASVALSRLANEPDSPAVSMAMRSWVHAGTELLVPSVFWLEVTNVLARRRRRTPDEIVESLLLLDELRLETVELDRPMLLLTLDTMARSGISAYDGAYVALAMSTEALLATLDRRLAEIAGEHGLLVSGADETRIGEQPTAYEIERQPLPWVRSAVVGAHIAELRQRLES